MISVEIQTPSRNYPVYIGNGLLGQGAIWGRHLAGHHCLIVSDENVAPHYLDATSAVLAGKTVDTLILPAGEETKSAGSWLAVHDKLVAMRASRDTTLIALGGGVIGDLAGFAAATYMRGIDVVQIPTSLLAQVDASVGGKTAINHTGGKNLIGAFHQPAAVVIDTATLNSLVDREYRAGLAEVVKYGVIADREFFTWLEQNLQPVASRLPDATQYLIERSVRNKARIVGQDEREGGIRALLNFGHTFAHAIETLTGYNAFLHGEAVAIGMLLACRLSVQEGYCSPDIQDRLRNLLVKFGLHGQIPAGLSADAMLEVIEVDKKSLSGRVRYVLLRDLGEAFICADMEQSRVHAMLAAAGAGI